MTTVAAETMARADLPDRESLRRRLQAAGGGLDARGWLTGDEGHAQRMAPETRTPAAVLLGLVARTDGPHVVLTQRTAHLKDHAGQISLPGGRIEPEDEGPAAAALREAFEEIGLAPEKVEVLGGLRHYDTITGFRIHPIVGWIEPPVTFAPDPFEVAEVFEVPLGFVLEPQNHRRDSYVRNGERRHFYVLPYRDRYIWGATAGILVNFARLLAG
ncbi:CoA pyrophosphatase [Benzoatithermus flavus]|uniref:CoA pyrophosphatase n=1 Tax=Benzoatithermus flavus TaxID=3108223 RepID=UPI003AAF4F49